MPKLIGESLKKMREDGLTILINRSNNKFFKQFSFGKFEYINVGVKSEIFCKEHNIYFTTSPESHLNSSTGSCPLCRTHRPHKTWEYYLNKFPKSHIEKYDYSKFIYTGSEGKSTIICPVHGEFQQSPLVHRTSGCPKCGDINAAKNKLKDTKWFIDKAIEKHGNYFNYSNTLYKDSYTKVLINCPKHGEFSQLPHGHFQHGCNQCSMIKVGQDKKIHDSKLKVDLAHPDFTFIIPSNNGRNSILHVNCSICNYNFKIKADTVYCNGFICPNCNKNRNGFSIVKPAILYYIEHKGYYKIGVTNHDLKYRFGNLDYRVIRQWWYSSGKEALKEERNILKEFSSERIRDINILSNKGGSTEFFRYDVLLLDNETNKI